MNIKQLKEIVVIDIETVSSYKSYAELPSPMKTHWERKASYLKNTEDLGIADHYFQKTRL